MEDFIKRIEELHSQIQGFQTIILNINPHKKQLRWFGAGRYKTQIPIVYKGTQDALNHAATLIGYFDGYSARGDFQRKVEAEFQPTIDKEVINLFAYIHRVLEELQMVLRNLLSRESLTMATNGPKKPGPLRTTQVCKEHLQSLERKVCALVIGLSKQGELQSKAQNHFDGSS